MEPKLTVLIIYLWPLSATSVYPVVGRLVENMEAIQHIEEVFDTAELFAGDKVEEINESNRRWDSGETRNERYSTTWTEW